MDSNEQCKHKYIIIKTEPTTFHVGSFVISQCKYCGRLKEDIFSTYITPNDDISLKELTHG